jgi:hypothetical protein
MAVIRVKKMRGFYFGDDAVLLAADREGMAAFERALSHKKKEHPQSPLIASGTSHEFHIGRICRAGSTRRGTCDVAALKGKGFRDPCDACVSNGFDWSWSPIYRYR